MEITAVQKKIIKLVVYAAIKKSDDLHFWASDRGSRIANRPFTFLHLPLKLKIRLEQKERFINIEILVYV